MEKILITGSSYTVLEQMGRIKKECGELRHVSVFFENYNFIIKNYRPMSRGVHLILEFEKKEVQIESANCGYGGGGSGASVELLTILGLDKSLKNKIEHNKNVSADLGR